MPGLLVFTGLIAVFIAWIKVFMSGDAPFWVAIGLSITTTAGSVVFAVGMMMAYDEVSWYHRSVMRRIQEVKAMRGIVS